MRARLAVCLLFSVSVAGACGGRLVPSDDGDGANDSGVSGSATSSAGATHQLGGRSGTGGTVAVGGAFAIGGAPSAGGFAAAGSTSSGGGCTCPNTVCLPGYVAVPNADGCCSHCEVACSNVLCPGIACGAASHPEVLAGQCCPTCVQESCEVQRAGYQALRQKLIENYSGLACGTNRDCVVYYEKNQCNLGCGFVVHSAATPYLDSTLQAYAQASCSPNCMSPIQPCAAPAAPICSQGLCR